MASMNLSAYNDSLTANDSYVFSNHSGHDHADDHEPTTEWKGLSSTLWICFAPIIFVTGIVGNGLILIIMNRKKFKGTTTCVYLGCLAAADMLVLVVGMTPEWLSADEVIVFKEISGTTCKIEKFVSYTIGDVAIWILMSFTIDRCLAVCFPFKKAGLSTPKRAKICCALLILIGVTKNFHVIWTRGPVFETDGFGHMQLVKNCGRPEPYTYFEKFIRPWIAFTLINFIPFTVIIICNSMIIRALLKSQKEHKQQKLQSTSDRHYKQLTFMCLSASFAFLVFVTPSIVLLIGKPYWSDSTSDAYIIAKAINNQLLYVNHSINFFLYCITGRRFRQELWYIFCSCSKRKPPFSDSDIRSQANQHITNSTAGTPVMERSEDTKNGFYRLGDDLKNTSCV